MENPIIERIQASLVEKRDNLTAWLHTTPPDERRLALGTESEDALRQQLGALDEAITRADEQELGRCEECGDLVDEELLEMDYNCCVCLDHLSTEETRDLERELGLARKVQRNLMPQRPLDVPGLDVADFSRPAQIVGGDYFDYLEFQGGANGVAIADVAGHGVSASLLMSSVQTLLRTLAPDNDSPAEVLRHMHRLYRHNIRFTTFVTMFVGAFDEENTTLVYGNAGHNPPLVLHHTQDGESEVVWLNPTGPAIGLVEEAEYGEEAVQLWPGDVLVMYTDGVTEAIDSHNNEFGQDRLADLVEQYSDLPASEIIEMIQEGLKDFTGGTPLLDDVTIVVCRINEM